MEREESKELSNKITNFKTYLCKSRTLPISFQDGTNCTESSHDCEYCQPLEKGYFCMKSGEIPMSNGIFPQKEYTSDPNPKP